MGNVEIKVKGGTWRAVSETTVRAYLLDSIDFINHYDLIETSAQRMDTLDLAIPVFLEAIPNFKKLLAQLSGQNGAPRMADAMARITLALQKTPMATDLWDWPDNVDNRSALEKLFRACRFAQYGHAMFTKMLHRKRPQLIPPIDSYLREAWDPLYWRESSFEGLVELVFELGQELGQRQADLGTLRSMATELGWPYTSLSKLRLYDIISWWEAETDKQRGTPTP